MINSSGLEIPTKLASPIFFTAGVSLPWWRRVWFSRWLRTQAISWTTNNVKMFTNILFILQIMEGMIMTSTLFDIKFAIGSRLVATFGFCLEAILVSQRFIGERKHCPPTPDKSTDTLVSSGENSSLLPWSHNILWVFSNITCSLELVITLGNN